MALRLLGHECVFASELDDELRQGYVCNFPEMEKHTYGDIRKFKNKVPDHDVLCAGFPCQPFSKSGLQHGLSDTTRGTLFDEIVYVLKQHHPQYVILENVGNFERHDKGRTWQIVKRKLTALGYDVRGTEHVSSGGPGLISPHHLGFPHTRERFFVVASLDKLPEHPFPAVSRQSLTNLRDIVQPLRELNYRDHVETRLTVSQRECIDHWNRFLSFLPSNLTLPAFPIWGDEIDATYPFEGHTPYSAPLNQLRQSLNGHSTGERVIRERLLEYLPNYAQTPIKKFPPWKIAFIRQNRDWFQSIREYLPEWWIERLRMFPPSLRKLEWNCKDEQWDLWQHVLQFRPSGLRVKRFATSPSLVAMTSTQIPILGPQRRFITRVEGLRLQGFPDQHQLPETRESTFRALGNAVHVGVVTAIAKALLA
jgi:DNA (cytosine-5)-methyltransferase 1